jgi:hypothetical protein
MTPIDVKMRALARSFPSLRSMPDSFFEPWDPEAFAEFWAAGSGGEKDAALFVLSVWNPSTNWAEFGLSRGVTRGERMGTFDVHRALGNWDRGHIDAFVAWAKDPWWA